MYYVKYLDDWLQRRLHDDVMVERWIRCRCCVLFHNAAAAAAAAAVNCVPQCDVLTKEKHADRASRAYLARMLAHAVYA